MFWLHIILSPLFMCGFYEGTACTEQQVDRCPFECVQAGGDGRRKGGEEGVEVCVRVCVCT